MTMASAGRGEEPMRASPEDDRRTIKHVNSNASSVSSNRQRSRRVKRTIQRQQQLQQQRETPSSRPSSSLADALVSSLANAAQAFLYPEDAIIKAQKENQSSNVINTSGSTVEMSDHDDDDDDGDGDEHGTYSEGGGSDRTRFDVRTPPPALAVSSALSSSVKRPIPVSSPRSGFDPVFPTTPFRDVSMSPSAPIARMRAPPQPQDNHPDPTAATSSSTASAAALLSNDEQSSRYSENFVADKHRKWRRQIKLQKKRLQQERRQRRRQDDDNTSLLTTCGSLVEGHSSSSRAARRSKRGNKNTNGRKGGRAAPVDVFAALIRAPCADVEDVMTGCQEGLASSDEENGEEENSLADGREQEGDDDETDSTHNDRQSEFTGQSEVTVSEYDRQSEFTGASEYDRQSEFTGASEYTDDRQSELTGATSEFTYDRQSDFTGVTSEYTDDPRSDFTGVSEYMDASSRRLSTIALKPSSSSSDHVQTISPSSSSIRTTPTLPSPHASGENGSAAKNFLKAFVAELTRNGMLLIWHGPHSDSTAFRRPCGVVAHLHLGKATDGIFDGPRLVWRKQDGSKGGVIDLFDIRSMETASLDMLESYHFAIPDNTFFVVLNNGDQIVFEASSGKEAKRFIHGLRWVVARLSFNLVVGNPLVSGELLSIDGRTSSSPQTPMEEALWSKAMNDVTNTLVDKSLAGMPITKVAKNVTNHIYDGSQTRGVEDDATVEELSNLCVD